MPGQAKDPMCSFIKDWWIFHFLLPYLNPMSFPLLQVTSRSYKAKMSAASRVQWSLASRNKAKMT
jgi:hypothetical protein